MKGSATTQRIADTLSKEGSLWFESAFCKGLEEDALLFSNPVEVVMLFSLSGLEEFFKVLEEKLAEGYFLAGWLSYEVGYGFEQTLFAVDAAQLPPSPLAWFGVFRNPEHFSKEIVKELFSEKVTVTPGVLSFNLSQEEYGDKMRFLKDEIAAGNVYQVNFTGRYPFTCKDSAVDLFCALRGAQPSSYTAYLNSGERTILSFSPELFFRRSGSVIETMPMKGTAPRGSSFEEDSCLREGLARCSKNLAENLMIVDLLRNDLGRICKAGSVETEGLFATETYPTLHQMVSTIRGKQREDIGLYELFKALYPSGSITGAPKIKAMKLIQSLETKPRGVYTGAIGFIMPKGDMVFNVAIRTVELSGNEGSYGAGSGIVWDSDSQEEYRECQLKAKILTDASNVDLELFESILWCGGYLWLQEHLDRLGLSARMLDFPCNHVAASMLLIELEKKLHRSGKRFKVRLSLSFQGVFSVTYEPVDVPDSGMPVKICLASDKTESSRPLLYHKTTSRKLYDSYYSLARKNGYDEVFFLNERDELTEGAISNIFIRKGRHFFTPPLHSGLLNGIFRQYFLATRFFASEKTLTLQDVIEADMIYIANSVRGLRPAVFNCDQITL
jgi:para-aminobenzoate synthetase/4-amino-4-deoxychorismate lyase